MILKKDTSKLVSLCLALLDWLTVEVNGDNGQLSNIKKLKADLLANYDKFALPFKNASVPVTVSIQLTPLSVMEVNEREEKIVLNAWVPLKWKDHRLEWEVDRYGGIERTFLTTKEIWHPRVIVLNSAPITNSEPWHKSNMFVYHTGFVYWGLSSTISTRCPMTFLATEEERSCNVSLASEIQNINQISLELYWEVVLFNFLRNNNSVWKVKSISAEIRPKNVDRLYTVATFLVKLQRRYDFTSDVINGPRIISVLLTLSMLWIPLQSKQKLKIGCLTVLIMSGTMIYLSSTVSSPTLLREKVTLLRATLFISTSALVLEIIILNVSKFSNVSRPPPAIKRVLTSVLFRAFGFCPQLLNNNENDDGINPSSQDDMQLGSSEQIENEWTLVATALDRFFFLVFALIYLLVSITT